MTQKEILRPTRRQFLKLVFASAGSAVLLSRCSRPVSDWRFINGDEASLLDALADQIVPPGEWCGGADAGVTGFIDQQLTEAYRHYREDYRKGLKAIQQNSRLIYGERFEKLSFPKQTEFLKAMESGGQPGGKWEDGFDRHFFSLLRDHCLQGFYGSPRHGGNRDYISYKMLKLDYPLIIGRNTYNS
ncbi:MAG: gluconate 2-dehydrogenase subunit 3 family protein [Bacteroidota bacterium]